MSPSMKMGLNDHTRVQTHTNLPASLRQIILTSYQFFFALKKKLFKKVLHSFIQVGTLRVIEKQILINVLARCPADSGVSLGPPREAEARVTSSAWGQDRTDGGGCAWPQSTSSLQCVYLIASQVLKVAGGLLQVKAA